MLIVSLFLLLVGNSYASEEMEAGSVLKEKSIVFTIDEAEKLKARIVELEEKERQLSLYKELLKIEESKSIEYQSTLELYKVKESNYTDIIGQYESIVDSKNKIRRFDEIEKVGYFLTGIAITVGSFYMTNAIINNAPQ